MKEITVKVTVPDGVTVEDVRRVVSGITVEEKEQTAEERYAFWRPKKGKRYWTIGVDSHPFGTVHDHSETDYDTFDFGNAYPTEEAAQFAARRQRALRRLERAIEVENEGREREGESGCGVFWGGADVGVINYSYHNTVGLPFIVDHGSARRIADWLNSWEKEDLRALFPGATI